MKQATTVSEQIVKLRSRGMTIDSPEKAEENLLDIGFYRLGFYAFPFEKTYPRLKNRDHQYIEGTRFEDIVTLYYFDFDLRNTITYYLNRIEISLRTYVTYTVSNHYKNTPIWFVDPSFVKKQFIDDFDTKVYHTIKGNPVIQRHHRKYINDRYAPAWKTMEFMTLGNILSLYDNLKDQNIKDEIAWHFGCNADIFRNYFETIRVLRNSCAHGACIYNIKLARGIKNGPAGKFTDNNRHNICGALDVIRYVIGVISVNRQNDMNQKINTLIVEPRSEILNGIIEKTTGILIKYLQNQK